MSELPGGWVEVSLSELGQWASGGTPSRGKTSYYGPGTPWVKTGDLRDAVLFEVPESITADGLANSAAKIFPAGTLLVAMYGATIGRTAVLGVPAATNQACAALLAQGATADVIPYAWWFLRSKTEALREAGQGGAQPNISQEILKALPIELAPLAEQQRIVAKLDALTARTARARADLDRIPALAARYKQAVLAKAFSGELTAEWRRENPTEGTGEALRDKLVQQRTERRRAEGVRGAGANRSVPTDDRALPTLPLGWSWMTFDQCSWDLTVGHVGPMKDRYVPSGVPFLRSLNIKPNAISLKNLVFVSAEFHAELRKSQLSAGTIVVIRTGEPGVAAVVPESLDGANCSDLVICRPVEGLDPHFGARYINSDFAKSFIRDTQVGVAQQHFNVGAMSKLPVPVAPAVEQAEIVRRIDHAFAEIDRLTTEAASARRLLGRLDQATLARAFRGELVPQDPTDEPASVLLDRIRAERASAPKVARGRRKAVAA